MNFRTMSGPELSSHIASLKKKINEMDNGNAKRILIKELFEVREYLKRKLERMTSKGIDEEPVRPWRNPGSETEVSDGASAVSLAEAEEASVKRPGWPRGKSRRKDNNE